MLLGVFFSFFLKASNYINGGAFIFQTWQKATGGSIRVAGGGGSSHLVGQGHCSDYIMTNDITSSGRGSGCVALGCCERVMPQFTATAAAGWAFFLVRHTNKVLAYCSFSHTAKRDAEEEGNICLWVVVYTYRLRFCYSATSTRPLCLPTHTHDLLIGSVAFHQIFSVSSSTHLFSFKNKNKKKGKIAKRESEQKWNNWNRDFNFFSLFFFSFLFFFVTCQIVSCVDGCNKQTIQYMARNRVVQTETRELASLNRSKIKPGETDDWRNEQLYVPPLPPTNLRGCHIIRIQYDVFVSDHPLCVFSLSCTPFFFFLPIEITITIFWQFQIEPHSMEKPIKLQLPIMLATYPLRSDDGTIRRKRGAHYPSTLPIFRPWLDEKTFD